MDELFQEIRETKTLLKDIDDIIQLLESGKIKLKNIIDEVFDLYNERPDKSLGDKLPIYADIIRMEIESIEIKLVEAAKTRAECIGLLKLLGEDSY